MTEHSHKIVICKECKEIVLQCKCFSQDKVKEYIVCAACVHNNNITQKKESPHDKEKTNKSRLRRSNRRI